MMIDYRREERGSKRVARGWYWITTSITDLSSLKSTLDGVVPNESLACEMFVEVGITVLGEKTFQEMFCYNFYLFI